MKIPACWFPRLRRLMGLPCDRPYWWVSWDEDHGLHVERWQ